MGIEHYMILSGALLVSGLLVRLELKRPNRARLALRCIAILAAIWSLALLAMPAARKPVTTITTGILVTEGYSKDSLAALQRNTTMPAYTPESLIASGDTSIRQWHILGHGLTRAELGMLNGYSVFFHPTPVTTGISHANWLQDLPVGQPLIIQGHYINREKAPLDLYLEAYGAIQDTFHIPALTENNFTLTTDTRHTGQAVFHLQLKKGKTLLENNAVPITVSAAARIRLLVLAASPDFEYRFLNRWLGEAGYPSVIRTRTSLDKYEQSFINHASIPLQNLTASTLDSFDIVISDAAALDALTEAEKKVIEQQVSNKGMGLLVRADTIAAPSKFYMRGFNLLGLPVTPQQKIAPRVAGQTVSLPLLPAEHPIGIRNNLSHKTWVEDASGNALVSSVLYGAGKIALSTIDNSYQWILGGRQANYAAYWAYLLEQLARKENSHTVLNTPGGFYSVKDPVPVSLTQSGTTMPLMNINGSVTIPLQQQLFPYNWQGYYWPRTEGWQRVATEETAKDIYIYGSNDWPMVKAMEKTAATHEWIENHPAGDNKPLINRNPLNPLWFVLLFLLSAGFLWVEKKYFT